MLSALIDRFQVKFPPNRLVALAMAALIPTVIAPLSAFIAVWVPAHFPGIPFNFTASQLTAFGIAGGTAALLAGVTAGYKFLDGWQKHEHRSSGAEQILAEIEAEAKVTIALIENGLLPVAAEHLLAGTAEAKSEVAPPAPPVPPVMPAGQ